ncbi:hypothetical protein BWK58_11910 [Flavobacterium columnare]|nr:hypothetical protein BWK58_11910 [Flavobacterium columnare]
MDLEIINPIESKKILGGDWYNDPTWDLGQLREVYVGGSSSGGGWYDPFGGWGDPWSNNSGSYDYGSGGGSNDGGPGEGKLPSPPNHICTQLNQGTTCATMALSYVANYLGGTGLTSSDFAEMVGNDYLSMLIGMPNPMTNVFSDGLSGAQISTIMSNVFQSTIIDGSTNSLVTNLNSGHPTFSNY